MEVRNGLLRLNKLFISRKFEEFSMRIQQLRDLLALVAASRLEMKALYRRLSQHLDGTRGKMMLNYLQQQQQQVHDALMRYIAEAPSHILDTWYDGIVFEDFTQRCQTQHLAANANDEDILEIHLDLEDRLIKLLEQGVNMAATEEIRGALMNLVEVERKQQKQLVHNVNRLEDL
jgi:hypothetical protein